MIVCQKCKYGKEEHAFKCKGLRAAPAMCNDCFREQKQKYDKLRNEKLCVRNRKAYSNSDRWNRIRSCEEERERRRSYSKLYNNSPQGKLKNKEYRERVDVKDRMKAYHQRPDTKDKAKKYRDKPEIKKKIMVAHRASSLKRSRLPEVKEKARQYIQDPKIKKIRLEYFKRYVKDNSANITDVYVRDVIRKKTRGALKAKDISVDLIELQKNILTLKRTIKQKNKENE